MQSTRPFAVQEGAGPQPDTPRKRGLSRLIELLGRDLGSIFKAGLLALAAWLPAALLVLLALLAESLPLVLLAAAVAGWLAGPAMVCLYDTILRALRTGRAIYDQRQEIVNSRGERVVLDATTIPISVDGQVVGAVDCARFYVVGQRIVRPCGWRRASCPRPWPPPRCSSSTSPSCPVWACSAF